MSNSYDMEPTQRQNAGACVPDGDSQGSSPQGERHLHVHAPWDALDRRGRLAFFSPALPTLALRGDIARSPLCMVRVQADPSGSALRLNLISASGASRKVTLRFPKTNAGETA